MPNLKLSDGHLFYEVKGEGPPLLLHHGLGRSRSYWLGFDKKLSQKFRVITFDMRGLGRSHKLPIPLNLTIHDLANDVRLLLDSLKIDRVHLLGTSMGGMVSLAFALNCPDRVATICLMNSSIGGQRQPRVSLLGGLSMLSSGIFPMTSPYILSLSLLGRALSFDKRRSIIEAWKELHDEEWPSPGVVFKHLLAALRFGPGEDFKRMKLPALIIYGEHDHLVPKANSQKIYKLLPHAELIEIKNGGHEMFLEQADEIISYVEEFILRHHTQKTPPGLSAPKKGTIESSSNAN